MKILYTVSDRRAAELAGLAIRRTAPKVVVAWAAGLPEARRWIDDNRDVAALIIEDESGNRSCASFLGEIRRSGVMAPVIVVSAQDPAPPLTPFDAAPDVIVAAKQSFLDRVPEIVSRALHAARRTAFDGGGHRSDEPGPRDGRTGDSAEPPGIGAPLTAARESIDHLQQELGGARRASEESRTQLQVEAGTREQLQGQLRAAVSAAEAVGRRGDAATEQLRAREAAQELIIERERARDGDLERSLAEAQAALETIEQRHGSELAAAVAGLAEAQARFDDRLAEGAAARDRMAAQLTDAEAARQLAEQLRARDAATFAKQLAEREATYTASIEQAAREQQALRETVARTEAALRETERRHAADVRAAEAQLAERQAAVDAQIALAAAARRALEQRLSDAVAALEQARQDHDAGAAAAAERESDLTASLAEATAIRQQLAEHLADRDAALQRAEQQHASEAAAANARLAEQQKEYDARLSEAAAAQNGLRARLDASEAALQRAEQQHASEMDAAAARLAEYRQETEARLAQTAEAAELLQASLADTTAALRRAEQEGSRDRQSAADEAAERQVAFDAELAQEVAHRQALEMRLAEAEAALQRAEQQHASEMEAAAARHAEYRHETDALLAQSAADAAAALQMANAQSAAEQQAAAELAAQRQAILEAKLGQEVSRREAVERALDETRAASGQAQRHFLHELEAMRHRAREREIRLDERAAQERAEWEATLAGREERIRQLQAEADLDRKSIAAIQAEIQRLETGQEEDARQRAELQQALDQARATAHSTLERVSSESAIERARFEAALAQREAQLQEQAARQLATDQATAATLADLEHRLRLALEARDHDSRAIEQLQEQLRSLGEELDATRSQRELLKTEAARVPLLREQIEEIRDENRRRFDDSPASLCRCSRGGTITAVNKALARMLQYETAEELLKTDLAATVCESGDELQWVIDRCLASGSTEPIETRWTRKDGSPVIVRLIAAATTADSIDLLAEDITALRAVEEQLRNAQRMEAVARYASEVAVTCDNLLEDVKQEAQRWLATIDSETARHHGELLLDEVTRATRFLRQLAVYGNEQKNVPGLVDVNKVLRDLAPVLKRVAGDGIQLVVQGTPTPLNLDVDAERVERILINVAGYGRERMPYGGRLTIEVASVTLDRPFVEKYPDVRPGAHVLLTITEVRGAARSDWLATIRSQVSGSDDVVTGSDRPGVDLRVLQALVSDCGGHLWMLVEPPGDMVLKIHLPRRMLDDRAPAKRSGGWVNRLAGVRF